MNAETIGRKAKLEGKPLTDLELLAEIARLKRTVASFGGAMLLAAYQAEAERRGFKEELWFDALEDFRGPEIATLFILKVLSSRMAVLSNPMRENALDLANEHGITVKDLIRTALERAQNV